MDSFGAVYAQVPAGGVPALEAAIREVRRSSGWGPLGVLAYDPAQHGLALVDRWGSSDDPPSWTEDLGEEAGDEPPTKGELAALLELSRLVGEVVAEYSIETDLCHFATFRDGRVARLVVWSEGRWSRLEGEAQPWEALLFSKRWLDAALDFAQDHRPAERPAVEAEARAAFDAGRLAAGSRFPTLIPASVNVSSALREALRLPPFGFQPWPRRRDVVKALPQA